MLGERVEGAGDLAWNAGAHEDDVHAREHRPVECGQIRHLHLREQIDPDSALMSVFRQPDLDERREDRQLLAPQAHDLLVHRERFVGNAVRPSIGDEIPPQRTLGDVRQREALHRTTQVAAAVTVLQPAHEDGIDRRAGDDTKLAARGDGAGELPPGDADSHSALNDPRRAIDILHRD